MKLFKPKNKIHIYLIFLLLTVTTQAENLTNKDLYTYKADVIKVYDGDTITVNIDLGFNVWKHGEKLRLARINAPEVRGKERKKGLISRDWLRKKILHKKIIIKTIKKKRGKEKKGKYGRYIVELYLNGKNLNDELVRVGLAEYKSY